MDQPTQPAFSTADIKALRLLAIALGVVLGGECIIARNTAQVFLAVALNLTTMVACPLVIYLLRWMKAKRVRGMTRSA